MMKFGPPDHDLQVAVTGLESSVTYEYSRTPSGDAERRVHLAEEFRRWSTEERTQLDRLEPIATPAPD